MVIAARNGQGNVVAGHVLGACVFNLLLLVGGMAVIRPLALPASFVSLELPAAMCVRARALPTARRRFPGQPAEGMVLVAGFLAWFAYELAAVFA